MGRETAFIGARFERLTVSGERYGHYRHPLVEVVCDCGVTKSVQVDHLVKGNIRSCGCLLLDVLHAKKRPYTDWPEYGIWEGMRSRCRDSSNKRYARYGGRGIRVCQRWDEFESFIADVGRRPSPEHSIERRDNDGDYEPGNCRWATRVEQARNKSSNNVVNLLGERMCFREAVAKYGCVSESAVRYRLRRGWDTATAILTPDTRGMR